MQRRSKPSTKQALIRRLKREGASARSQFDGQLCDRIMQAVDSVRQEPQIETSQIESGPSGARVSRTVVAAALVAAAGLLLGLGLAVRPAPPVTQPHSIPQNAHVTAVLSATKEEMAAPALAEDLFSAPAAAVESLSALQAHANPLDELQHDAQLAGQMALSALPTSGLATD